MNGTGAIASRGLGVDTATDSAAFSSLSGLAVAWYLRDRLGSVRDVVDNSGTVTDHVDYSAFGQVISDSPSDDRFKYAGMELDSVTGLHYVRARWYDPAAGKFLNPDPLGFAAGDPNLQRYVANAPTNAVDPSGLFFEDPLRQFDRPGMSAGTTPRLEASATNPVTGRLMTIPSESVMAGLPNEVLKPVEVAGEAVVEQLSGQLGQKAVGEVLKRMPLQLPGPKRLKALPKPAACPTVPSSLLIVPGRARSRINLANKGWAHLIGRHFSGKTNASQFTLTQADLKILLQSKQVVGTPITRTLQSADGIRYVREVDLGRQIGLDRFDNFSPTNVMSVLTDQFGNLITATPGIIK